MKLNLKIALVVTGAAALFSLSASMMLLRNLLTTNEVTEETASARYHFAFFVPQDGSPFFKTIAQEALAYAREQNISISIHYFGADASSLSFAPLLGINGIAVCPSSNSVAIRNHIDQINKTSVPVVVVNLGIQTEKPTSFVGTNNYDYGKKAGELVVSGIAGSQTTRKTGTLAVIYSEKTPSILSERELFEMGIQTVIDKRKEFKIKGTIATWKTALNPQNAESLLYNIVHSTPDLSAIIFTDEYDTIAGCQALIDLNLIGRITIVGAGSQKVILEYIRKGIITGSVYINPALIAEQAIRSLTELCSSGYTSDSLDTSITVIDSTNLLRFKSGSDPL